MTRAQLALILAGWAFKSSLLRGNGDKNDKAGSMLCLVVAIGCLYWGLSR